MIGGVGTSIPSQFYTPASKAIAGDPGAVPAPDDQTSDNKQTALAVSGAADAKSANEKPRDPSKGTKANGEPLNDDEERQVRKLKETDAKVRAHEQAHAIVGGPYASAPKYELTTGPDGKRYATSGEVQIDVAPEDDPEATIRKMDVVIRAALAPADPSPQDLQVARQAQTQRAQAQVELSKQREAELDTGGANSSNQPGTGNGTTSSGANSHLAQAIEAYVQAASAQDGAQLFTQIANG